MDSEIPFDDLNSLFFSQTASCIYNKDFSNSKDQGNIITSAGQPINLDKSLSGIVSHITNIPER
jgi:hypothetical protein